MDEHLNPGEARHALDIAAGQRRRVSDAAMPPLWTWPAAFAAGFVILWGSSAGSAASMISWVVPVL